MAAPEYYCCAPLENPGSQIRLLKMLPSPDKDAVVQCTITPYKISEPNDSRYDKLRLGAALPPYFALSYVCGSGNDLHKTKSILIHGRLFPLTERVYAALRLLRSHVSISLYLWVDCICISQTDLTEKSQQILLMQRIYSLSAMVLVWLYPSTPDSERALRFIRSLFGFPMLAKASDKFIQLYDSRSQPGTRWGLQQSFGERVIRAGYSMVLNLLVRTVWGFNLTTTVLSDAESTSNSCAPIVETQYQYQYQYPVDGDDMTRARQSSQRTLQIKEQLLMLERIQVLGHDSAHAERLQFQNLSLDEPMSLGASATAIYQIGFEREKLKRLHGPQSEDSSTGQTIEGESESAGLRLMAPTQHTDLIPRQPQSSTRSTWTANPEFLKSMTTNELIEMTQLVDRCLLRESNYFGRMWTMQEPCVGRAGILSETIQITFEHFLTAVQYLKRTLHVDMPLTEEIHQLQWIGAEWHSGARLPLRTLLYESRKRQCFDPRDKIYALLSLMCERQTILVQPDYAMTVSEVFANACRFIVASDRSLDVICASHTQQTIDGLPSWCPDFRYFGITDDITPLIDLSGRHNIYHASLSELPARQESPFVLPVNWPELKVTGICLGSVCKLSGKIEAYKDWGDLELKWRATLLSKKPARQSEEDCLNALSRLMTLYDIYCADKVTDSIHAEIAEVLLMLTDLLLQTDASNERLQRYFSTLVCGRQSTKLRCSINDIVSLMRVATTRNDEGDAALTKICESMKGGVEGRRLCVLKNEDIIGACPMATAIEDSVFVLIGCNVPVVLRKAEGSDHYQLIGECYCHGFMDGEALKLRDEAILEVSEFTLR